MREIARSALVPYTPEQMFALVDDIERYPEFLPWVTRAEVLSRDEGERVGRLHMARGGMNETFTTRNTIAPPTRLQMKLVEGPFRLLEGVWSFDPIVDAGAEPGAGIARGTRVSLSLRFEFKNRMLDLLLAPKFAASCDALVDAFAKRARDVY